MPSKTQRPATGGPGPGPQDTSDCRWRACRNRPPARPPDGARPGRARAAAEKGRRAQRVLREPRPGLAVLIGAAAETPGATYITALHDQVTGKSSTATKALAVVAFVFIEFSPVIIRSRSWNSGPRLPTPELQHAQHWLMSNARQLIAAVAIVVGAYMAISGLVACSPSACPPGPGPRSWAAGPGLHQSRTRATSRRSSPLGAPPPCGGGPPQALSDLQTPSRASSRPDRTAVTNSW